MPIEKRNAGVVTSSSRAVAYSNNVAGTFKPAVPSFQRKPIDNEQEGNEQKPGAGLGMPAVAPFQLKSDNAGVIQRKVLVNGFPAVELGGGKALVGGNVVTVPGDRINWVRDGYARRYNAVEEFMKHAGREPVGVGLAKRLGLWYRLPPLENKKFFVLGESHNAFGYRELMNESNQKGKVLGEGGSNTLMSATSDSPLEKSNSPGALEDDNHEVREYAMENLIAKAYYSFVIFKSAEQKKSKETGVDNAAAVDNTEREAGDVWLANYQHAAKADRRRDGEAAGHIPYYNRSAKKVYAQTGTAAEGYASGAVGNSVLTKFYNAIKGIRQKTGYIATPGFIEDVFEPIMYFVETHIPGTWIPKAEEMSARLLSALGKGVKEEADLLEGRRKGVEIKGQESGDFMKPFLAEVKKRRGTTDNKASHGETAFAYRNFAMYRSVIKASRDGFVMAGMGDHHAQELEALLGALTPRIDVITMKGFMDYSTDAISPMTEQDEEFAAKRRAMVTAAVRYQREQNMMEKEEGNRDGSRNGNPAAGTASVVANDLD
ncbi:hypothetical protein [Chitinophaga ginsengisoli]|uniref:Uncharacterized protein n=1 Tax=Chitinophaga ginsengisoli TaxID=363837 RepID=A0A2P8FMT9_9BACT|nr:hypothetical protein [Chitinophaga ginsengisoli]PSL23036.1 hypothetical protein CLV42_11956 [Chitinophaga ginsengisoli]